MRPAHLLLAAAALAAPLALAAQAEANTAYQTWAQGRGAFVSSTAYPGIVADPLFSDFVDANGLRPPPPPPYGYPMRAPPPPPYGYAPDDRPGW